MGREPFSKPEESRRERDRKAVLQIQYVLLGAIIGSTIGSAEIPFEIKALAAILLFISIVLVNRSWSQIHGYLGP